jgi:hypothetical protein
MTQWRTARKQIAAATMVAGLALLGVSAVGSNGVAAGGDSNKVSYWCPTGGVKYEPVATPFVVPAPHAGYVWTKLVLKAATDYTVIDNPVVGPPGYTSGIFNDHGDEQAISFAILCKSCTTTTTTTLEPTTTATPAQGPTTIVAQAAVTTTVAVGAAGAGGAATTGPGDAALPATGSRPSGLTVIAVTLIALGAVMLRLASKPGA